MSRHCPTSDDDILHRFDLHDWTIMTVGSSGRRQGNLDESERTVRESAKSARWIGGKSRVTLTSWYVVLLLRACDPALFLRKVEKNGIWQVTVKSVESVERAGRW